MTIVSVYQEEWNEARQCFVRTPLDDCEPNTIKLAALIVGTDASSDEVDQLIDILGIGLRTYDDDDHTPIVEEGGE